MELKKSSSDKEEEEEELSIVKAAAAWARYKRGGGRSERTRTRHELGTLSPPGSLLLDLYEVEQITKELNQLLTGSRRRETDKRAAGRRVVGFRIEFCRSGPADVIHPPAIAGGRRLRGKKKNCSC